MSVRLCVCYCVVFVVGALLVTKMKISLKILVETFQVFAFRLILKMGESVRISKSRPLFNLVFASEHGMFIPNFNGLASFLKMGRSTRQKRRGGVRRGGVKRSYLMFAYLHLKKILSCFASNSL